MFLIDVEHLQVVAERRRGEKDGGTFEFPYGLGPLLCWLAVSLIEDNDPKARSEKSERFGVVPS